MKTLILLDPDPDAWGECDPALAARANEILARLLRAEGYDVGINTIAETQICCDDDDVRAQARRDIERNFMSALEEVV